MGDPPLIVLLCKWHLRISGCDVDDVLPLDETRLKLLALILTGGINTRRVGIITPLQARPV